MTPEQIKTLSSYLAFRFSNEALLYRIFSEPIPEKTEEVAEMIEKFLNDTDFSLDKPNGEER